MTKRFTFRSEHRAAARAEGWDIFECCGSMYGRYQICKMDEPDDGELELADDEEAWRIVFEGTKPHHRAARNYIQHHCPDEWVAFCHHAKSIVGDLSKIQPEVLVQIVAACFLPNPYKDL
jgi:hypothetical protein